MQQLESDAFLIEDAEASCYREHLVHGSSPRPPIPCRPRFSLLNQPNLYSALIFLEMNLHWFFSRFGKENGSTSIGLLAGEQALGDCLPDSP